MTDRRSAIALLVNQEAGCRYGTPPSVEELMAALERYGLRTEPIVIKKGSDPSDAARTALGRGAKTLVTAGGDGTVSAVAATLLDSEAILGVLPTGTLNHFARDLGIPLDLEGAAGVLVNGVVAKIDVGEVNGRGFINNSSIGVYPEMVARRENYLRIGSTQMAAVFWAIVATLRRAPFLKVRLTAPETNVTMVTPMIFVGNNEYQIDGFEVGQRRRLDAGRLFLYAVNARTPTRLLYESLLALLGRLRRCNDFHSICAVEAWIDTRRKWVTVSIDGEVARMATPLHYRTRPAALRVIVPERVIVSEKETASPL